MSLCGHEACTRRCTQGNLWHPDATGVFKSLMTSKRHGLTEKMPNFSMSAAVDLLYPLPCHGHDVKLLFPARRCSLPGQPWHAGQAHRKIRCHPSSPGPSEEMYRESCAAALSCVA